MSKSEDKILDLVKEFRKPKSVRNGISHECAKVCRLMNEHTNESLSKLEKQVRELKERSWITEEGGEKVIPKSEVLNLIKNIKND